MLENKAGAQRFVMPVTLRAAGLITGACSGYRAAGRYLTQTLFFPVLFAS